MEAANRRIDDDKRIFGARQMEGGMEGMEEQSTESSKVFIRWTKRVTSANPVAGFPGRE